MLTIPTIPTIAVGSAEFSTGMPHSKDGSTCRDVSK